MNIENAINRIKWRFKNENVKVNESKITINDKDIEAIDFLIDWINREKKEVLKENFLLAKFVTNAFINEIIYNEGNPKIAQKNIIELAKTPINQIYNKAVKILNQYEFVNYCKSLNIDFNKHNLQLTESESKKEKELINNNQKKIIEKIKGTWTEESVYKSLNNTITELLNRFKNNL